MTQPSADTDPQPAIIETTDPAAGGAALAAVAAPSRFRRSPLAALRHTIGGIGAVSVKELRGRMRGRRAFVILTIYLLLLGGFALMVELIAERTYSSGFGGTAAFATASIGQGIFAALILMETLQVAFLAPASTAGAISLEREKRTLELLVVTPISSLAIVLGKLFSALIYVWLLIAASIPLTAIVFVYGGVAPEDIVRAYLVLVVTALGLGSFGLFASSLVRRTQAATAISVFAVLVVSIGTLFMLVFWGALANDDSGRGAGPIKGPAPRIIAYVNPFLAQVDVLCGTEASFGGWCQIKSSILPDPNGVQFTGTEPAPMPVDNRGGAIVLPADGKAIADVAPVPFGVVRDTLWPLSVLTWLILSAVFIVASVQFVSPNRRWHLRRGRRNPGSAAT